MKGTAPRHSDPAQDAKARAFLAEDLKNRAENLMIVDLLRNDLGKLCTLGSVRAEGLFAVESFATVHQMTSLVRGQLKTLPALGTLLRALFPCGSITGAPKFRAMETLRTLERVLGESIAARWAGWPRWTLGVQRGDPDLGPGQRPSAACRGQRGGLRQRGRGGIRGGPMEGALCEAFSRDCALIETFFGHRKRGAGWGRSLGAPSPFRRGPGLPPGERRAVGHPGSAWGRSAAPGRLTLARDGALSLTTAPFTPIQGPWRVGLSPERLEAEALWLRYKTTDRGSTIEPARRCRRGWMRCCF